MHENRETSPVPATKCRPIREGIVHKTDMNVGEESDSGVVPMKRLNKSAAALAESAEGRLLIKENIEEEQRPPTPSGILRDWDSKMCAANAFLQDRSRVR
jgi:hypothetical protein